MSFDTLKDSKEEQELSQLMRKSQSGDRTAYTTLLEKVQTLLMSFVQNSLRKATRDADSHVAQDIVQEALLGIHAKRDTYDPQQFFLPWMYAIARYKIIDYFRFQKTHARNISLDEPGTWEKIASPSQTPAAGLDAHDLLNALPKKQKNLLLLVKLQGHSIQEAAVKTGLTTSDVKVSLHRGIKFLKKQAQTRKDTKHES